MARQADLTSMKYLVPGILTAVIAMILPGEVASAVSKNLDQIFSTLPLSLPTSPLETLGDTLKTLGRKRRYVPDVYNGIPYALPNEKERVTSDSTSNLVYKDTIEFERPNFMEPISSNLLSKRAFNRFILCLYRSKRSNNTSYAAKPQEEGKHT